MARYHGNLALNSQVAPAQKPKQRPPSRRVVTPLHADPIQSRNVQHTRAVRKSVTSARIIACVWIMVSVVALFSVFGTLLYRQSRIIAMQFENTDMEMRTQELRQGKALLEEAIMKDLNLSKIRMQAIERLGMQETGRNKIISTDVVTSDRVIVNTAGLSVDARQDMTQQLEDILGNLEGFFKKIR